MSKRDFMDDTDHGDDDRFDEIDDHEDINERSNRRIRDDLPDPYAVPEVEELIEEAIEMLAEARPLPMSTTVKVNRDDLLHLLERAQDRLPEELRAARWLLKERDDFVAKARQEHQDLIDEGRAQVGRMVERQQVVKAAELRARQIVSEAREEANSLKRQVEDYCDQRLASFEIVLERTASTVRKGRERLMGSARANTEEILSAANGSHLGRANRQSDDIDLASNDDEMMDEFDLTSAD